MTGETTPRMPHLFAAGGTAGFMYWVFFYPLDVIKSAMQTDALEVDKRRFRGVVHTTTSLWAEGGVSRFYKGVTPCLLRAVPANAIMLITVVRLLACSRVTCSALRTVALPY
jgi:solute carrier family 25 carnitine/acylcarnitine transporter 20/29